jgi:hypothetical protein
VAQVLQILDGAVPTGDSTSSGNELAAPCTAPSTADSGSALPASKTTSIVCNPAAHSDRTANTPASPITATSSGTATWASTSRALAPGHGVTTSTDRGSEPPPAPPQQAVTISASDTRHTALMTSFMGDTCYRTARAARGWQ